MLARLNEIKFASGIIDEFLYLDLPRENRFSNGLMMLEYRKAVQETVHEQFRVIREGHLRIIFSQDLKVPPIFFRCPAKSVNIKSEEEKSNQSPVC